MATDNPVQRQMLNAGMHILNLANELTKASESGAENGPKTAVDATVGAMKKFAAQVINGAAFIGSCLTHEEVAEAENVTLYDIEKAKAQQESLERLEPFFRGIRQRMSEDKARSDAVESEKMELVATLEDEVIRLRKENEELKSSYAADLQRVRAEAERAIKEAEERSVATSAEIVLPRPRRTKTTGRSRDDESVEEEIKDDEIDRHEETAAAFETTAVHLTCETAVAIEDEETCAATTEAAAETATAPFDESTMKEAATLEGGKLLQKYHTLNFGLDEQQPKPIATATMLVSACKLKLLGEFTQESLCTNNINGMLQNLLCVIEGVDTCREQLADIEEQRAALLQSLPTFSDVSQSRGALMNSLGGNAGIDYKIVLNSIAEESAAGQAIKDHGKGKLTVKALESFSIHPQPVQTLIQIVIHLDTAVEVLAEFTDYDLFVHLSQNSRDCIEFKALSAELYQRQFKHDLVEGSITLLQLIVHVIVPFLRSVQLDDKMKAVKLALLIKRHVTNVGNGRGERKGFVLTKYRAVARRPVRGNGNVAVASAQENYFDVSKHRAGTMIVFFVFLLINEIEAKFDGGCRVGLQVLDLSWTDLTRQCNKLLQILDTSSVEAFGKVCAESDFKALNNSVTKEKKTNVVIFNRQQMDCLHALLQFD